MTLLLCKLFDYINVYCIICDMYVNQFFFTFMKRLVHNFWKVFVEIIHRNSMHNNFCQSFSENELHCSFIFKINHIERIMQ